MDLVNLSRKSHIFLLVVVFLVGCGITSGPGTLRGNTVVGLRFPSRDGKQEIIALGSNHIASRTLIPITASTPSHTTVVSDPLWTELEQLRLMWCQQPPQFASTKQNDDDFQIILKCNRADDPIYFVHPSELPLPLRKLINLLP